jgi:peptidyl-prolyl cis-trans isomerase A (cyclophilin A)
MASDLISRARPRLLGGLLLVLLVVAAGACAPRAAVPPEPPTPTLPPLLDPASPQMNVEAPDLYKVLFETSAGDFVVAVERALAPRGADRFYNLVRAGYYDGVRFFRVVPGFVVQFGLSGDPEISSAWRTARIPDDSVRASNTRGMITYAKGGPDTRTVQVYVNLGDNSRLDDQGFAPFGRVSGGMDVVDALYGEYGDGPPRGQGPTQDRIGAEGETYLAAEFPELDQVIRATVVQEERFPPPPDTTGVTPGPGPPPQAGAPPPA